MAPGFKRRPVRKPSPIRPSLRSANTQSWPAPLARLRRADDHGYVEQKLLLGTHTSEDEDNHLLVAKVCLPADESDVAMDTGDGKQGKFLSASRV